MLDSRVYARLTENYREAAVGYANASAAAMNIFAQQAMDFWTPPARPAPSQPRGRDHLSWFNPHGSTSHWGRETAPANPWAAFTPWGLQRTPAPLQPSPFASQMMAMTWAFAPFASFWGSALRGPTFAWPMAYAMMAQGVPDSIAWPAARANAAMTDAATTITEQTQNAFASYQSAGGFAMAHVISPRTIMALTTALTPLALGWMSLGSSSQMF